MTNWKRQLILATKAYRFEDSSHMWLVIDKMSALSLTPDSSTYAGIISRYIASRNLEMALQFTFDMNSRGIAPDTYTAQNLIKLAAETGFPRLALDLARAFEESGIHRLDHEVWVQCLASSARALYVRHLRPEQFRED